jgi:hypothetical protein
MNIQHSTERYIEMTKAKKKITINVCAIILALLLALVIFLSTGILNTPAFATQEIDTEQLHAVVSENFTSAAKNKRIGDYFTYAHNMDDRQFANRSTCIHRGRLTHDCVNTVCEFRGYILDAEILNYVPRVLFEQRTTNFVHVGERYSFVFTRTGRENNYDTFLIYFFRHSLTNNIRGQLVDKIEPLFYDEYNFNGENIYSSYFIQGYDGATRERFFEKRQVFLKDVGFQGILLNEHNLNHGAPNYNALHDRGAFFFGSYYEFNGTTFGSGFNFGVDLARFAIGQIGGASRVITLASTAWDIADLGIEWVQLQRGQTVSNANAIGRNFGMPNQATEAMAANRGQLPRLITSHLGTVDDNALLFGIGAHVQTTFHYTFAEDHNRWNSVFSGELSLNIAIRDSSISRSVTSVMEGEVLSNSYRRRLNNDETLVFGREEENTIKDIRVLFDGNHRVQFQAHIAGKYTFTTLGNVETIFATNDSRARFFSANDSVNQIMEVELGGHEIFTFAVGGRKFTEEQMQFKLHAEFTPDIIEVEKLEEILLLPSQYKAFVFHVESPTFFVYNISALTSFNYTFHIARENTLTGRIETFTRNTSTSNVFKTQYAGRYFFHFANYGNSVINLNFEINLPDDTSTNYRSVVDAVFGASDMRPITRQQVYTFEADRTTSLRFTLHSNALISMSIYSEILVELSFRDTHSGTAEIVLPVIRGQKFYIVLNNRGSVADYYLDIAIASLLTSRLQFDRNTIFRRDNNTEAVFAFLTSDMPAIYTFTANNPHIDITTSNNNQHGIFMPNSVYYVYVTNITLASFELTVGFVHTTQTTDIIGPEGFAIVRFIPPYHGRWNAMLNGNLMWHDFMLNAYPNNQLLQNQPYFIRVEGAPGSSFNVEFSQEREQISQGAWLLLDEFSLFSFDIINSETSNTFEFVRGGLAWFTLYDFDLNPVRDANNNLLQRRYFINGHLLTLQLPQGTYLLRVSAPMHFSLNDNPQRAYTRLYGTRVVSTPDLTPRSLINPTATNLFVFDADRSATFVFGFSTIREHLTYYLTVTRTGQDGKRLTIFNGSFKNEETHEIHLDLVQGNRYEFEIHFTFGMTATVVNARLWLRELAIFQSLRLTDLSNNSIDIMTIGAVTQRIVVDRFYTFSTPTFTNGTLNSYANSIFSWSINANGLNFRTEGNGFYFLFDNLFRSQLQQGELGATIFLNIDGLSVRQFNVIIQLPVFNYRAAFVRETGIYSVSLLSSTGPLGHDNPNISIMLMIGRFGSDDGIPFETWSATEDFTFYRYFGINPYITNTIVVAFVGHSQRNGNSRHTITMDLSATPTNLGRHTIGGALSNHSRILIDAETATNNQIVTIDRANIRAVFVVGATHAVHQNLTININNNISHLFVRDLVIENNFAGFTANQFRNAIHSNVNNLTIHVTGTLNISGVSQVSGGMFNEGVNTGALIFAGDRNLSFAGATQGGVRPTIHITAAAGRNNPNAVSAGFTGGRGQDGFDAVRCATLTIRAQIDVTLIGGAGGNGGRGGNGQTSNPSAGQSIAGGAGGTGGAGGSGGVALRASLDRSAQPNIWLTGGDGGDGGMGGTGGDGRVGEREGTAERAGANGGRGGNGGAGGVAGLSRTGGANLLLFGNNNITSRLGTSGTGGTGGTGGRGSNGVVYNNAVGSIRIAYRSGIGGRGGDGGHADISSGRGGDGGVGGMGGHGLTGFTFIAWGAVNPSEGGRGGDGGNGRWGGTGGRGGQGGDGFHGSHAQEGGRQGSDGGHGARGGHGGNGGNVPYGAGASAAGVGGFGGLGGWGGNPGTSIWSWVSYAGGNNGPDGGGGERGRNMSSVG